MPKVIIKVTPYITHVVLKFPVEIFAPTNVDVRTEGNLTNVEININLIGLIGKIPSHIYK